MAIDAREQPPAGHIVLTDEDYCALPDDGKRHEIWLVDPEARVLEVSELGQGGYRRTARLSGEADFVPAPFSGLTIRFASLWS